MSGARHTAKAEAPLRLTCAHCRRSFRRRAADVRKHRSRDASYRFYCGRTCFGLARRVNRTVAEKKARKSNYDRVYRETNQERIRQNKAEFFQRTYDPDKARADRALHMADHVEYCRRYFRDPVRKQAKVNYDRKRRAELEYGPFAEAAMLLVDLDKEIRKRASWYERARERGYYERTAQQRKRNAGISRW